MRTIKCINENWLFTMDEKVNPASLPAGAEELNLPHTWNGKDGQDGGNDYKRQKCWYFKEISKADLTGEENFLEFVALLPEYTSELIEAGEVKTAQMLLEFAISVNADSRKIDHQLASLLEESSSIN